MPFFNLVPRVHLNKEAQIASLFIEEVRITDQYLNFVDILSEQKALVVPELIEFNQHAINLKEGKQPSYGPIYNLGLMELETLKTYIKTHLKTGFIWPSKSLTSAPILFNKKSNGSIPVCVDYHSLNNLTIKNRYLSSPISRSLDLLSQAMRFIQLNLTSTYYGMRIKENDKWKTAFQTRYSHCKDQVTLFGLSNAPELH